MNARSDRVPPAPPIAHEANERFKRGSGRRSVIALVLATLAHVLVFAFGPTWRTSEESPASAPPAEMQAVLLLPATELPAPPERIAAPAVPIVRDFELPDDFTIEPVADFDDVPDPPAVPEPPPPSPEQSEFAEFEHFTPYMVRPELKNRAEVQRALERRYPNVLRMGNVEGAVIVLFWIDEAGAVQKYEIRRSSGSRALDRAVEEVIEIMEFRPAMDRGEPVKVIVALPIRFQIR